MTLRKNIFGRAMTLFLATVCAGAFGALSACSGEGPAVEEEVDSDESELIGGVDAKSASMNAVGTLGVSMTYCDEWGSCVEETFPFCSGTLISTNAVLTAKHCTALAEELVYYGYPVHFGVGPDGYAPKRTVTIVDVEGAPDGEGCYGCGFVGYGRDVGVAFLEEEVTDVTPFRIAEIQQGQVGSNFAAIGFGVQNNAGVDGTRKAGTVKLRALEGKVFELMFGSFEGFLHYVETGSRYGLLIRTPEGLKLPEGFATSEVSRALDPEWEEYLRWLYDNTLLLPGYEAWVGDAYGNAQPCYGDSGSPLVKTVSGTRYAYGVTSGGMSSNEMICDFGAVYAVLGPETYAFVDGTRSWVDPCGELDDLGYCDGDIALRCTVPFVEGPRRPLETDCSLLGLTCGYNEVGQVACVDPYVPPPCPEAVLPSEVPLTVFGDTTDAENYVMPTCGASNSPERTFEFTAPETRMYELNTFGSLYDTVLAVRDAACEGAELACNDDAMSLQSQVFVELAAGQTVVVVVDGFGYGNAGPFMLTIQ